MAAVSAALDDEEDADADADDENACAFGGAWPCTVPSERSIASVGADRCADEGDDEDDDDDDDDDTEEDESEWAYCRSAASSVSSMARSARTRLNSASIAYCDRDAMQMRGAGGGKN
jgi:hypothetical protein